MIVLGESLFLLRGESRCLVRLSAIMMAGIECASVDNRVLS
jgi:hypothetical protein